MSPEHLILFLANKEKIFITFEKFKHLNNFFAVYFSSESKLYSTLKVSNDFSSNIRISKNNYSLAIVLNTSLTFTEQTENL